MARLLCSTCILALILSGVPAIPLPRSSKQYPICHPIRLGDRSIYYASGDSIEEIVTKVERVEGGWFVTTASGHEGGQLDRTETIFVSATGVQQTAFRGRELPSRPWKLKLPHSPDNEWKGRWDLNGEDWKLRYLRNSPNEFAERSSDEIV